MRHGAADDTRMRAQSGRDEERSRQEAKLKLLQDMKSYAIALPERVEKIMDELSPHQIKAELFPAVDMRQGKLPDNWLAKGSDYGCSQSWLGVLDHAIQRQDAIFCVFEDDFVFRYDVLDGLPDLAEIESCPFDVIYMTGHYAKGGTRIEPRRVPFSPRLVRASGIHTTPARIFTRDYARYLLDRLGRDVRENGYGADRTDSILQVERRKTYAFECHIGGQRSADSRSWEPRVFDYKVQGPAAIINTYPSELGEGNIEQSRGTIALASRVKRIAAINCSTRTLGLLAEGVTDNAGHVQAFNDEAEVTSFRESGSDRLHRYIGYGSLSYNSLADVSEASDLDCIYIEVRREVGETAAYDLYAAIARHLKPNGLLIVSPRDIADRGWMSKVKFRRVYRSYGNILFGVPAPAR
jgi:GR25 family glycosyltransferase involved in LPS biosynthesis